MTLAEQSKKTEAQEILERCVGRKGIWADPTRYAHQCWTRDMMLAIMPVLLAQKRFADVRNHLENLSKRQKPNGQIPILYLDGTFAWLASKLAKSIRTRKMSFMLKRFLAGELWNLTPGTRDSEIMYLLGMLTYAREANDWSLIDTYSEQISRALSYVETSLMHDGLILGADWRDTMHRELNDKALLTNNSILYHVYLQLNKVDEAVALRQRIDQRFWSGSQLMDYPGATRFDPLGAALAIIFDVVPPSRFPDVVAGFRSVDTQYGVSIKCRHNPTSAEEASVIERTDGVVVWPFIVGFTVLALDAMGEAEFAQEQFAKLSALKGFREWYDPESGNGYGAHEQLWSATLYLRAQQSLQ